MLGVPLNVRFVKARAEKNIVYNLCTFLTENLISFSDKENITIPQYLQLIDYLEERQKRQKQKSKSLGKKGKPKKGRRR